METKTCTKCGEVKEMGEFSKHSTGKFGRHPRCRECRSKERRAELVAKKPLAKKIAKRVPGRTNTQRGKIYLDRHPEAKTRKRRRQIENMSGAYVRGLLAVAFGVSGKLISNEVVELKRQQLLIHRSTKQLIETIKEKQDEH